ncbi:MAG: hypothetical protein ABW168_21745, partial [Sedimenticola sp.]
MSEIIPAKLNVLLQWVLEGVSKTLPTEKSTTNVDRRATAIAQQIMYETKTNKQVKYQLHALTENPSSHHRREYPIQVGTGILIHQKTRNASLIDYLHHVGMSVEYSRILRIETQLAQAVLNRSAEYDVYVPPSLVKNEFIFFAIDNSDFSEDTPEGKNTLHATAMVVYQRASTQQTHVTVDITETAKAKSLPLGPHLYTEIQPYHIPANTFPVCPSYDSIDTTHSHVVTSVPMKDDITLSIGQSLVRSRNEKQHIPSWSAYNSIRGSSPEKLTAVAMLPLLAAPAHEFSTLVTVLKQAQTITTVVMGEGHKTVITFDLQLYEKAVKLQMHMAPAFDHLVFRLGEMHTVLAALRAVGTVIEESGIDDAWIEADLYGSTTTRQIIEGRHMKRALTAHSITSSVLSDLHLSAFLQSEIGHSDDSHADLIDAASKLNSSCQTHAY